MFGFSEEIGEFKIEQVRVNDKESLPKITRATGGPIPVIPVEKTDKPKKK